MNTLRILTRNLLTIAAVVLLSSLLMAQANSCNSAPYQSSTTCTWGDCTQTVSLSICQYSNSTVGCDDSTAAPVTCCGAELSQYGINLGCYLWIAKLTDKQFERLKSYELANLRLLSCVGGGYVEPNFAVAEYAFSALRSTPAPSLIKDPDRGVVLR